MINLEIPKKIEDTRALLHQFSLNGLRPLSRKYDLLEQKEMPEELYELVKLLKGADVYKVGRRVSNPMENWGNTCFFNSVM